LLALKTQYSLWHLPFMKVKYIIRWGLLVQQADSSLPSFISLLSTSRKLFGLH
jgi:hypothetical protein